MRRLLALIWLGASLAAAFAGLALLPGAGSGGGPEIAAATDPRLPAGKYHAMREGGSMSSACAGDGCHGADPHRSGEGAAFLNGHANAIDCSICHLAAPSGVAASVGESGVRSLAGAPGGEIHHP